MDGRPGHRRHQQRSGQGGARGRREQDGAHHGRHREDRERRQRRAHPELLVEQGVDVVDDPAEHLAATAAEPARGERHDALEDGHPPVREHPQRGVVTDQPLAVPQHRPGDAEGADRDDRDHQEQHRRVLGGPSDQPGGGDGQADARGRGEHAEQQARVELPPPADRVAGQRLGRGGRRRTDGRPDRRDGTARRRRGQRHHRVGVLEQRRGVGDHHDGGSAGQPAQGLRDHLLGGGVEVGRGLVHQHQRTLREHRPGQREPGPLTGRETLAVLPEDGAGTAGERVHGGQQADPVERAADLVVRRARPTEPDVLGERAGHQPGPLRDPGDRRPPAVQPLGAPGHPVGEDLPGVGLAQPGQQVEERGLAAAGRTADGGQRVRPDLEPGHLEGRRAAARIGDGHPLEGDRPDRHRPGPAVRGGREQRVDLLEGRRPLRRGMELRPDPAQRPVGLGRQQQHHQRRPQVQRPGRQPQPDHDRHHRDRQRGHQLQHRRGRERQPQRVQGGPAVAVGDAADGRALRAGPLVGHQRGQPVHHVDEVTRQRGQRPPAALGAVAGGQTDEHREHRHQRQRHRDDAGREQVLGGDREQRERRQHHGQHQGRQVAGQVRVDRDGPPGQQQRQLALPGGPVAAGVEGGADQPVPQVLGDPRGGPSRARVPGVRRQGPRAGRGEHQQAGVAHVGPGASVDQRHDQVGDREQLGEQQQAAQDAGGDQPGQCGGRTTKVGAQPRVQRPHRAGAGAAGVGAGPAGGGTGMWCTEIRRRNTQ